MAAGAPMDSTAVPTWSASREPAPVSPVRTDPIVRSPTRTLATAMVRSILPDIASATIIGTGTIAVNAPRASGGRIATSRTELAATMVWLNLMARASVMTDGAAKNAMSVRRAGSGLAVSQNAPEPRRAAETASVMTASGEEVLAPVTPNGMVAPIAPLAVMGGLSLREALGANVANQEALGAPAARWAPAKAELFAIRPTSAWRWTASPGRRAAGAEPLTVARLRPATPS